LTCACFWDALASQAVRPRLRSRSTSAKPPNIAIIKRYIEGASLKQGTALFRRIWKSGGVGPRLSAQSVNLIAKRLVGHAYSGHSLRVGFAVSAAEAGVDLRSIATVTRHTSMEMPKRYVERADQLWTSPYKVAGVGLSSEAEQVRLWPGTESDAKKGSRPMSKLDQPTVEEGGELEPGI
jgi:hypothetical protein